MQDPLELMNAIPGHVLDGWRVFFEVTQFDHDKLRKQLARIGSAVCAANRLDMPESALGGDAEKEVPDEPRGPAAAADEFRKLTGG